MTAPSPGGVQRWRCYYKNDFNNDYDAFSEEDPDGEWVRYGDHAAEVGRHQAVLDGMAKEANERAKRQSGFDMGAGSMSVEHARDQREVARLRKALEEYGSHSSVCATLSQGSRFCNCGYAEALRGAAGEVGNGSLG